MLRIPRDNSQIPPRLLISLLRAWVCVLTVVKTHTETRRRALSAFELRHARTPIPPGHERIIKPCLRRGAYGLSVTDLLVQGQG